MKMNSRWFRRRPSDEEMRDELESHVTMRAEHDGVDKAAAQRRLGNALQTREAMRCTMPPSVMPQVAASAATSNQPSSTTSAIGVYVPATTT